VAQRPTAHYNRANALRGSGRKIEAVESYRKALALSPMYGKALNNLSVTLTELGRYEEALAVLDQLVRVEPASARAHSNRGLVLGSLGRGEEARREFERALQLDPAMAGAAPHLRGVGATPSTHHETELHQQVDGDRTARHTSGLVSPALHRLEAARSRRGTDRITTASRTSPSAPTTRRMSTVLRPGASGQRG